MNILMNDLIERLERSVAYLDADWCGRFEALFETPDADKNNGLKWQEAYRIKGKAEGVRLALSYVQEMVRDENLAMESLAENPASSGSG